MSFAQGGTGAALALPAWPAHLPARRATIALLLIGGATERGVYNLFRRHGSAGGEAFGVARALGAGHGFADAYGPGHGPTAHLLPISPGIAGGVYGLLGVQSPLSEFVLATWSICLALGSFLLFDRAFARLGVSGRVRLAALAFLCLAPTYIAQEAVDFRVWEGGLAVFVASLLLNVLLDLEGGANISKGRLLSAVVVAGLFFINPLAGSAGVAALLVYWLRQRNPAGMATSFSISAIVLAALVVPWMLRNERVLGYPIPLRSNTGLELAIGQHPGALAGAPGNEILMARLTAIHPAQSRRALAAMKEAGGEVRYSQARGTEARHWMAAHPRESMRLILTHFRETLIPSPWMFRVWGNPYLARTQGFLAILVGVFGLFGLATGLASGRREWTYVALYVLVPAVLLSPFQPVMRYSYLEYAILTFCAVAGLEMVIRRTASPI